MSITFCLIQTYLVLRCQSDVNILLDKRRYEFEHMKKLLTDNVLFTCKDPYVEDEVDLRSEWDAKCTDNLFTEASSAVRWHSDRKERSELAWDHKSSSAIYIRIIKLKIFIMKLHSFLTLNIINKMKL